MITIRNLKKSFGDNLVFEKVDAEIKRGDVTAVIGPSGCGKSTFVRCINLLEEPDTGEIIIDGVDITKKDADIDGVRKKMGMVYQSFNLFSHLTVLENVIMAPVHVLKMPRKQAITEGLEILKMVGIAHRADFMPHHLSGGQKQRAAIARCLAMHPEIILFDEPTSALDPTMIDEVLSVIRKLTKTGLTCVIVTHEMGFARNIATQVFYMDDKGIYERGTPEEIFEKPQGEKTRIFINKLKVFEYTSLLQAIDIYEFNQKLSGYCQKYDLTRRETNNINLVLEELIVFIMGNARREEKMSLSLTYSEQTGEKQVDLRYTAPVGNILGMESFDELSLRLVKGLTRDIFYSQDEGGNLLKLRIH